MDCGKHSAENQKIHTLDPTIPLIICASPHLCSYSDLAADMLTPSLETTKTKPHTIKHPPDPGIKPKYPALQADSLLLEPPAP